MVRYAVSMGIRMVCFILAVILQNWMTWVLLAAAVVLPYVAVTTANVGSDRYMGRRQSEDLDAPGLLTTTHEEGEPEADQQWWEQDDPYAENGYSNGGGESEVITGELVESEDDQTSESQNRNGVQNGSEVQNGSAESMDAQDPRDDRAQDRSTQPLDDQDTHR